MIPILRRSDEHDATTSSTSAEKSSNSSSFSCAHLFVQVNVDEPGNRDACCNAAVGDAIERFAGLNCSLNMLPGWAREKRKRPDSFGGGEESRGGDRRKDWWATCRAKSRSLSSECCSRRGDVAGDVE